MRYSEKWGDSIDAAVDLALQELKLTRDQVTVTVLEQPSKGFFGIGSKLAKVHVEEIGKKEEKKAEPVKPKEKPQAEKKESSAEEQPKAETEEVPVANEKKKKKNKKKNKQKKENREEVKIEANRTNISTKPENLTPAPDHPAKEFLDKTFKEMGIEVSVSVETNEDSVYIDVEGKDTGTVIGKRGQTLDAVQYLTSLVVNKDEEKYVRVVVDAENYRTKRGRTLEQLAEKLARKVVKNKRSVRLEPMNPYERKVIHATLQGHPKVTTRSIGDEPRRRVIIELK